MGSAKDSVRARLYTDQHGLCCYCYVRIANDHTSHIEHVEPQSNENRFDWENLALTCEGGNQSGAPAHCDHGEGQEPLDIIHPYRSPVSRFVALRHSGTSKVDEQAERDVDTVLNLDARHLRRLRESALKAALSDLARGKRRQESWQPGRLQSRLGELQRWTEPLDYQPLIEAWLEPRLRRAP